MNMKQKQRPLKIEFKQFQRLPEWPIIPPTAPERPLLDNAPKTEVAASLIQSHTLGIRSFAE